MNKYIPLAAIVLSNVFYNICTKSTPDKVNPFLSLVITYLVGATICFILYLCTKGSISALEGFKEVNWTSWVLGLSIVGLEVGYIYLYKAGWEISSGQLIQAALVAVCLVLVGVIAYKEKMSVMKLAGIATCLVGLVLINKG